MFKFFLVLVILGQATCYHSYGHGNYPQHNPSTPSQMTWNQPSNGHPHHWNYQTPHQWEHMFGWFNPSGIYEPSQSYEPGQSQSYKPSQSNSFLPNQSADKPSQSNSNGPSQSNSYEPRQSTSNPSQTSHADSSGLTETNDNSQINKDQIDKPFNSGETYIPPTLNDYNQSSGDIKQFNTTYNLNATDLPGRMNNTDRSSEIKGSGQSNQTHSPGPEDKPILAQNDTDATSNKNTRKEYPTTPSPATGSRPVPALGEFQAPSLQWHVGIYTKTTTPFTQICGGSLVKADVVISAAHCFWKDDEGLQRAALYAVATGKLQRSWDNSADAYEQHSDIKELKIPPRFQGSKTSLQDDLAIARLTSPLELAPGTKPICVDFSLVLERSTVATGRRSGTIAGWGLTTINGSPSERLNFLQMPHVAIGTCIRYAEPGFLKYITSDKFCAGDSRSGRALCRGDSGGGLAFYSGGIPFLLGIASAAPRDNNECNAFAVATFTYLRAHMLFLIDHVPDISEGCQELYEYEGKNTRDSGMWPSSLQFTPETKNENRLSPANSNVQPMAGQINMQNQVMGGSLVPPSNVAIVPQKEPSSTVESGGTDNRNTNLVTVSKGNTVEGNHTTFKCNCFCKQC